MKVFRGLLLRIPDSGGECVVKGEAGGMLVAGAVQQVECPTSTKPNIHAQDGPECHLASQHRSSGPEQNVINKHLPVTKNNTNTNFTLIV
jgi:hypothetical protein